MTAAAPLVLSSEVMLITFREPLKHFNLIRPAACIWLQQNDCGKVFKMLIDLFISLRTSIKLYAVLLLQCHTTLSTCLLFQNP